MSSRTIARSSSNMNSASARASSVFPTPVGPLELHPQLVDPLRDLLDAVERLLLLLPARPQLVARLPRFGKLPLDRLAYVLRFLRHRGELDLELPYPPLGLVELDR